MKFTCTSAGAGVTYLGMTPPNVRTAWFSTFPLLKAQIAAAALCCTSLWLDCSSLIRIGIACWCLTRFWSSMLVAHMWASCPAACATVSGSELDSSATSSLIRTNESSSLQKGPSVVAAAVGVLVLLPKKLITVLLVEAIEVADPGWQMDAAEELPVVRMCRSDRGW